MSHFTNDVAHHDSKSLRLDISPKSHLTSFKTLMFSLEEIKDVVWDCGLARALGPDGFIFWFIRHFWEILGSDVISCVQEFYMNLFPGGVIPLITLIPKVDDPIFINDYRPISLIGIQFKVTTLLSNRLVLVLHNVIGLEQSAFLKDRQILDGPLLVNELVRWFKKKK